MENAEKTREKSMTFLKAILVLFFLIAILMWSVLKGTGNSQIPLLISAIFAAIVALLSGYKIEEIENGMIKTVNIAVQQIVILMVVGCLIGVWMLSGTVPIMIYYGLKILSPSIFLVATLILCSVVALCVGSSWTTMSTVGIALFGISIGLGIPPMVTVGAIVSGSYFGDKMSPLSETTNLAPAVAGSNLFEHIKHMMYTTGVSYVLSIIFFLILGFKYGNGAMDTQGITVISNGILNAYNLSPFLIIPPIVVLFMAMKKIPPITTLSVGTILGAVIAMIFQGSDLISVVNSAHFGFISETGVEVVDNLLSRGGMEGMMFTISLIICAMVLGGVLECTGVLQVFSEKLLTFIHTKGTLILATILSSIGTNLATGDQSLAIILPGRIFKKMYDKFNLKEKNLSRCLEDAGTLTSPLVPWNVCGAFIAGLFGVPTLVYLPFCFLNYVNPIVSIVFGFLGFTIEEYSSEELAVKNVVVKE